MKFSQPKLQRNHSIQSQINKQKLFVYTFHSICLFRSFRETLLLVILYISRHIMHLFTTIWVFGSIQKSEVFIFCELRIICIFILRIYLFKHTVRKYVHYLTNSEVALVLFTACVI